MNQEVPIIPCRKCGHLVPSSNMALHQASHCEHEEHAHHVRPATTTAAARTNEEAREGASNVATAVETFACEECHHEIPVMNRVMHYASCHRQQQQQHSSRAEGNESAHDVTAEEEEDDDYVNVDSVEAEEVQQTTTSESLQEETTSATNNAPTQTSTAAAAATSEEEQWACPRCTLLNPVAEIRCDACLYMRHFPSLSPMPSSPHNATTFPGHPFPPLSNNVAAFPGQHLSAANNANTPTGQHQHANTTPTNPTGTAPTPPQFNVQVREVDPRVASALTSASNIVSWSLFGGLLGGPVGAMVGGATAALVDGATRIRAATRARSSDAPPPQPQRMITISTQGTNNNTGRTYRSVQTIRVNPNDHLTNGLLHQLSQTDQRILQMLLMHALQNPNQDIDNMTYDQLLEQFGVGNTQRRGASQEDIDKVPLTKITGEMVQELKEEEIVCNICLEDFKEGEEMRSMDVCCHKFHKECLDRWLSQVASCPVCKKELGGGGGGGDGDHDHGTNENVAVVEERQEQQSSSN